MICQLKHIWLSFSTRELIDTFTEQNPRSSSYNFKRACFHSNMVYYRPQRSSGQGYVFTRVCDSVHRGVVCLSACWDTTTPRSRHPWEQTPPGSRPPRSRNPPEQTPSGADTSWEQTPPDQKPPWSRHLPGADTPPEQTSPQKVDSSIRSMSGRYASYWNAFLLLKTSLIVCSKNNSFQLQNQIPFQEHLKTRTASCHF